jgi:hypothetical protein
VVGWPAPDTVDEAEAMKRECSDSPQTQAASMVKRRRTIHVQPPKKMMRLANSGSFTMDMLHETAASGLSGGKDSFELFPRLMEIQRKPRPFETEVRTIDPMTPL